MQATQAGTHTAPPVGPVVARMRAITAVIIIAHRLDTAVSAIPAITVRQPARTGTHQPATANYYGGSCYNCGSGGWGAAAAGAAVGATVGVAAGVAASSSAYSAGVNAGYAAAAAPPPAAYAVLPAGCVYRLLPREYSCGSMWLAPAYGANGVYYRVVAPLRATSSWIVSREAARQHLLRAQTRHQSRTRCCLA